MMGYAKHRFHWGNYYYIAWRSSWDGQEFMQIAYDPKYQQTSVDISIPDFLYEIIEIYDKMISTDLTLEEFIAATLGQK